MLNVHTLTDQQLDEYLLNGKISPDVFVTEYNRRIAIEVANTGKYEEHFKRKEFT